MNELINKLGRLVQDPSVEIDSFGFSVALLASILAAVVVSALYQAFYERRSTGAQIHRSFLLIAPSITAIFIGVQFSLPLSLGLLGALSIIRFRTPIKEPEEVGFIMLIIACAVVCATFQFLLLVVLLVLASIALLVQRYVPFVINSKRQDGVVVITIEGGVEDESRKQVLTLLDRFLSGGKLQAFTYTEGQTVIQYSFAGVQSNGVQGLHDALQEVASVERVNAFFNSNGSLF